MNVFLAGDGNLHPLILYDGNHPGELDKTERFGAEILRMSIDVGGTITGEHGVGNGKLDFLDAEHGEAVAVMRAIKQTLDPDNLLNPGKVIRNK